MIKKLIALAVLLAPAVASAQWTSVDRVVERTNAGIQSSFDRMHIRRCIRHQGRNDYTDIKCQYGVDEADRVFGRGRYGYRRPGEGTYPSIGYAGRLYRGPQYQADPYGYGGYEDYEAYGYPGSYGYYDGSYGYGPYGGLGIEFNGRTLGTVAGGVAGGVIFRKKGPGAQAAGIIGGAVLGNILGGKVDDARQRRNYREEVRRMTERSRPVRPEEPSDDHQTEGDDGTQQVPSRARRLCNRSGSPILVYRDNRELGELAPDWAIFVQPGTELDVRSEACELQGQETGNDIVVTCAAPRQPEEEDR